MVYRKRRFFKRYWRRKFIPRPVKRYVHRAIARNIENKYAIGDLNAVFGSIPATWTEQVLVNPSQGVTPQTRLGNKIKIKSLEMKGVMAGGCAENVLDDPYNVVRIVIGLYNGSDTTPLTDAPAVMDAPITTRLYSQAQLIKKYYDKYFHFNAVSVEKNGGDGYASNTVGFRYYKRFKKPLWITWGDDSTTYPTKYLIMSALSDSGAVPHPGFIAGYWKVTYEDA